MYIYNHLTALLPLLALMALQSSARPLQSRVKREVPQEHSHEQFLTTVRASLAANNPLSIQDPVFGLLGNAAASQGQGQVTNTDCLQQATADQAFTNAKAADDVAGMTAALIYRALERNTGAVGQTSVSCNETALNPEIQAISQHQDPASDGAAATNKAITLALAQQIAAVGGDAQDALKAGTFAPGQIGDPTAAGNTCDDANDPTGCIFTQNLLIDDATADEINAAVASGGSGGAPAVTTDAAVVSAATGTCSAVTVTITAGATAAAPTGSATNANSTSAIAPAATNVASTSTPATGIDVGPCTDFSMTFAAGLDGRAATEFSFEPTDQVNFNHGTALNPEIISQFMCDTFVNACGKSATTRDTCNTVKTTIDAQLTAGTLAKDQTYADAWLSGLEQAFGITSTSTGSGTGTGIDAGSGANTTVATATGGGNLSAVSSGVATPADTTVATRAASATGGANISAASSAAVAASSSVGGAGTNVQVFTGSLNGVLPTPVLEDDTAARPFTVGGDTFLNKAAAIQRSCDQQFNGCANAANSGKGTSSVSDCQAQETQCQQANA
ncbi:hypothetical protein BCR39DRAFT_557744 [Naematelia encephala]|uniref:Uncharacterized protein n=1 Tax=Naematelia encephala TaxID=71784 RepID=A0A1Y2BC77_9TREE|nr:hypothetical protein BCR39DRAFT_557744 [Naematelia encephala]